MAAARQLHDVTAAREGADWVADALRGQEKLPFPSGPLGVETADRIGDCQVQRAGCLIPAVVVAGKGRHEVNSSVSRELGASWATRSEAHRTAWGQVPACASRYLGTYLLEHPGTTACACAALCSAGYGTQILQP